MSFLLRNSSRKLKKVTENGEQPPAQQPSQQDASVEHKTTAEADHTSISPRSASLKGIKNVVLDGTIHKLAALPAGINFLTHNTIQMKVDLVIQKLQNLPSSIPDGSKVFVRWKEGLLKSKGETKKATVHNREVEWSDEFSMICKVTYDSQKDTFSSKVFSFSIYEEKEGKSKSSKICSFKTEIHQFKHDGEETHETKFPALNKTSPPVMMVMFRNKWLKVNEQVITPTTDTLRESEDDSENELLSLQERIKKLETELEEEKNKKAVPHVDNTAELESLRAKVAQLNKESEDHQVKNKQLHEDLESLKKKHEGELDQLREELKKKLQEIQNLQTEKDDLLGKEKSRQLDDGSLIEELSNLKKKLSQTEESLKSQQVNCHESHIVVLEVKTKEIERLTIELDHLRKQHDESLKQLQDLKNHDYDHEGKLDETTKELEKLKAELHSKEETLEKVKKQNALDMADLKSHFASSLSEKDKTFHQQLKEKDDRLVELQNQLNQLNQQSTDRDLNLEALRTEIQNKDQQLKQQKIEAETKEAHLLNEKDTLSKELDKHLLELKNLQTLLESLKKEKSVDHQNHLQELEKEKARAAKELEQLIQRHSQEIDQLKSTISRDLSDSSLKEQEFAERAAKELADAKSNFEKELEKVKSNLLKELEQVKANHKHQMELSESDHEKEMEQIKNQLNLLREQIKGDYEKELNNLKQRATESEKLNQSLQIKETELQALITTLQNELKSLKDELQKEKDTKKEVIPPPTTTTTETNNNGGNEFFWKVAFIVSLVYAIFLKLF